ncbi:hypothetical protein ACIBAG_28320 [Streptomyces sp. NPDC051243]|uniref:hypothetical protein n=1 Tax=Streptomyces sp. NPDC051243 TaxID=3365646 RepID=UPI0037AEEAE1
MPAVLLGAAALIAHLLFDRPRAGVIPLIAVLLAAPVLLFWPARRLSVLAAARVPGPLVQAGDVLNHCGARTVAIHRDASQRSEVLATVWPLFFQGRCREPDAYAAAGGGNCDGYLRVRDRASGIVGWVERDRLDWMPSVIR